MGKAEFLRSKELPTSGGAVTRLTMGWTDRIRAMVAAGTLPATRLASLEGQNRAARRVKGYAPTQATPSPAAAAEGAKLSAERAADAEPSEGAPAPQLPAPKDSPWDLVMKWRSNQAVDDWRVADQLKSHVKLKLHEAMRVEKLVDPLSGEVRQGYVSQLNPLQIRQLAEALAQCQRVQRLALGLSTDNLGVDPPAPTGSEQKKTRGPLFVVEVDDHGKFKGQRPRRIS